MAKANGEIIFRVGGGDGPTWWEAVQPDGTGGRTVIGAHDPVHFDRIAWSPDGSRIAFRNALVDAYGIYTANADGSDVRQLTDGVNDSWPSWSPDETKIVFSSTRNDPSVSTCTPGADVECPTDLFVMNADGSNIIPVSSDLAPEFDPVWSPDGSTIAFVRRATGSDCCTTAIWTVRTDGSDARQVAATTDSSNFAPSWSPDGTQLAYLSIRGEEWWVYVNDVSGSEERTLVGKPFADDPGSLAEVDDVAWSPDGAWIAFTGSLCPCGALQHSALYLVHPDGSALQEIATPDYGASDIAWRPTAQPALSPVAAHLGVTVQIGAQGQTNAIALGEGGLWVATYNASGDHVVRLDPITGERVADIAVAGGPSWEWGGGGLTTGLGRLWVLGTGILSAIDPGINQVIDSVDLGAQLGMDVVVADGSVWALLWDHPDEMRLVRVDPDTLEVIARIPLDGVGYGHHLLATETSVISETNEVHGDTIEAPVYEFVDPSTNSVVASLPITSTSPALDAWLWMVSPDGLQQIDPHTGALVSTLDANVDGSHLWGGSGLWFVNGRDVATLMRIDTSTGTPDVSVELPPDTGPLAIAASASYAWVVNSQGTVTQLIWG